MYVNSINNIKGISMNNPDALNVLKKVLIGPKEGWQGWVMRLFTIGKGGHTPKHAHPWPHINYVVKGEGTLILEGHDYSLQEGSVAYIPGGSEHQFQSEEQDLTIICIVPEEGER